MTFKQSINTCFREYAVFSGRASRSEYWYWVLFTFLVSSVIELFGIIFTAGSSPAVWVSVLSGIFALGVLVPGLAVAVRRMHDIGKGGGWIFITLVPLIGWIWFIVLCCQESQPGENRFGEPVD